MSNNNALAGSFRHVVPIGTASSNPSFGGSSNRKPWHYKITACIPHLDTIEPLRMCIELLRAQSEKPFIMVIDTGSPPDVCEQLESMRAEDLEIHYVRSHGWNHSSEAVTVAMDLTQTLCRTEWIFHTHADCFLRRRDLLESWMRICTTGTPVVGYRMSPRDWVTKEWEWMVGHTALMCYMPSIHRAGATWAHRRSHYAYQYPLHNLGGWPDTETGFNHALRDAGIAPVFLGFDRNHERCVDDNLDHVRSYAGSKTYSAEYHGKASGWMDDAMKEASERLRLWQAGLQ